MRIAISGFSGCGNTTVSSLLSQKLGFKLINYTFRNMAEDKGMTFEELRALAQKDDIVDIELDRRQVELAESYRDCILASRLAVWMLECADLKVFLDISVEERCRRVWKREGGELSFWISHTEERDKADTERYKRIYRIDNHRFDEVADLVIRGDSLSPDNIVDLILEKVRS